MDQEREKKTKSKTNKEKFISHGLAKFLTRHQEYLHSDWLICALLDLEYMCKQCKTYGA